MKTKIQITKDLTYEVNLKNQMTLDELVRKTKQMITMKTTMEKVTKNKRKTRNDKGKKRKTKPTTPLPTVTVTTTRKPMMTGTQKEKVLKLVQQNEGLKGNQLLKKFNKEYGEHISNIYNKLTELKAEGKIRKTDNKYYTKNRSKKTT